MTANIAIMRASNGSSIVGSTTDINKTLKAIARLKSVTRTSHKNAVVCQVNVTTQSSQVYHIALQRYSTQVKLDSWTLRIKVT